MSDEKINFVPGAGTCVPWTVRKEELGEIPGNEAIVQGEWDKLDAFAYAFIWFWVQR